MNDTHRPTDEDPARRDQAHQGHHRESYDQRASGGGVDRDRAEREARAAIGNARDELQSMLENQKNAAASQVRAVADALRDTEDGLRDKGQSSVAAYVAHVADRIDYWAGRLQERHIQQLSGDIQRLANRQPGLFIAGTVIAGFVAVRFLKSTSAADSRQSNARSFDSTSPDPTSTSATGGASHASTSTENSPPMEKGPVTGSARGKTTPPDSLHS